MTIVATIASLAGKFDGVVTDVFDVQNQMAESVTTRSSRALCGGAVANPKPAARPVFGDDSLASYP
jgi:hypothetical protein